MKVKKFSIIHREPSVRISLLKTEEFNRVYDAKITILKDGMIHLATRVYGTSHLYRTRPQEYTASSFLKTWQILDRRVLIEKVGYVI